MSEVSDVSRILGEAKKFTEDFRFRLIEVDTLLRIADAPDNSTLAKIIPPEDRSRICAWRDTYREGLKSIIDVGIIYELKQQDPYALPEFGPDVFREANNLAGTLLEQLTGGNESS